DRREETQEPAMRAGVERRVSKAVSVRTLEGTSHSPAWRAPTAAYGRLRKDLLRALADEVDRVDLLALVQDLEVQVRSGGAAGVAHQRDRLALLHLVADGNEVLGVVRVTGGVAIAVID